MTMTLSGPMFEAADSGVWRSIHRKAGAHYNTFACKDDAGMDALREFFPSGTADEMSFVLFSTSGVHGTYGTIEDAEQEFIAGVDEDGEPAHPMVTFLVVQPRIVCTRYGNCRPRTADDFVFLKGLRESSWHGVQAIGKPETPTGDA